MWSHWCDCDASGEDGFVRDWQQCGVDEFELWDRPL